MRNAKFLRVILPLLPAIIIIGSLYINALLTNSSTPKVQGGVLDLLGLDLKNTGSFYLAGDWEFYWDRLLGEAEIKSGTENYVLTAAPDIWNDRDIGGTPLPGFGKATYRINVTGVPVGDPLAFRIENMASVYRLYADNQLIAHNGSFGDKADARISDYSPQFTRFIPQKDSFELILHVSNDAYAVGGMWEPIMFGNYSSVARINDASKIVGYISIGSLIVMCLFFAIMYAIIRKEKELLILSAIGVALLIRLTIYGDILITQLYPSMPIAGFGWIDYLTGIWIQFLMLCFINSTYPYLVKHWHTRLLLVYTILVSAFILLFPFDIVASTYVVMNLVLLMVVTSIVLFTARAALEGRTGARSLLAALALILFSMLYQFIANDLTMAYFLFSGWVLHFTILFFVQCTIVARRYNEAQRMELGLLKSQIRPHFVHNALATIISISRKEPERSRELLIDFSSYLRGCYDYEGDDLIPLEEELEFIKAYVALEQARFGDKYKVEYQIEVQNLLLPPLILQPLVENAFVHGLREKEEGGLVIIYTKYLNASKIKIGVVDDGLGMKNKPGDFSERSGIGIANINRRLARLYHAQLEFVEPSSGGLEVFMEIPLMEADIDENYAY